MNLYEMFEDCFASAPDRIVFRDFLSGEFSGQAVRDHVLRLSRGLDGFGLRPGDRLVAKLEKSPFLLFLYYACLRRGIVFIAANPKAPEQETLMLIRDAEPAVIVTDDGLASGDLEVTGLPVLGLSRTGAGSLVECGQRAGDSAILAVDSRHPATMIYTSGTTGAPKGVLMPHGLIIRNAALLREAWNTGPEDVMLHSLPMFNSHGLSLAVNSVVLSGGSLIFLPRFDVDAVATHLPEATMFSGVPTMYIRLLDDRRIDAALCRNMRLFVSSSAAMPEVVADAFEARTGHRILECYGLTETGTITSNRFEGHWPGTGFQRGSVGVALPGVEMKILDSDGAEVPAGVTGALLVRKPEMFLGYWRRPDETAGCYSPDGMFRTGDLASIGTDGFIRIAGRARDVVITGGFNVFPREIELALARVEGVGECAVVGVPHPSLGEAPIAVVVVPSPHRPDEAAMLHDLRQHLAPHKLPRRVLVVDSIPRSPAGKIDSRKIREDFQDLFTVQNSGDVR